MGDEKDAFYVVRKGDVIGVYKSLSDLQALLRSCVGEPVISVFKGYRLAKESEEYLASHGLKNAMYSIDSSDVRDDLFGILVPCPFRQPGSSKDKPIGKNYQEKSMQLAVVPSASFSAAAQQKHAKLDNFLEDPPISTYCLTCILEFDGASKGNPGLAGAGAVLRAADGSMVFRLREGLGVATNNVAEYRGVILGLKYALEKGFKHIRVQGDSKLVCMQTQGIWKCKNQNMAELCKIVKELKDQFMSFQISHIEREWYNLLKRTEMKEVQAVGTGRSCSIYAINIFFSVAIVPFENDRINLFADVNAYALSIDFDFCIARHESHRRLFIHSA